MAMDVFTYAVYGVPLNADESSCSELDGRTTDDALHNAIVQHFLRQPAFQSAQGGKVDPEAYDTLIEEALRRTQHKYAGQLKKRYGPLSPGMRRLHWTGSGERRLGRDATPCNTLIYGIGLAHFPLHVSKTGLSPHFRTRASWHTWAEGG